MPSTSPEAPTRPSRDSIQVLLATRRLIARRHLVISAQVVAQLQYCMHVPRSESARGHPDASAGFYRLVVGTLIRSDVAEALIRVDGPQLMGVQTLHVAALA